MGRALSTDVPGHIRETAVRPDALQEIIDAKVDPYVTDQEMRLLLERAYFDLVEAVLRLEELLLGEAGEEYDPAIEAVGLSGSGGAAKIAGFRRALTRVLRGLSGRRGVKKAFDWGNIILGSLGAIPAVGLVADPIRELKESVEAQGDDDQQGESPRTVSW